MGSVGDAYDNAMAESFFATLECELLDRRRFQTQAEAKLALFQWIEGWYNPRRRHSSLGYLSPNEFERRHAEGKTGGLRPGRAPRARARASSSSYSQAEGTYRAARALVHEAWYDVRRSLERGDMLSVRQYTSIRLGLAHVTWAAAGVADLQSCGHDGAARRDDPDVVP
jgi:hypothetical protein